MPGDVFYVDERGGRYTFRIGFSKVSLEEIERGFKIIGDVIEKLKLR